MSQAIELATDLSDWWVLLRSGETVRVWASSHGVKGPAVVFGVLITVGGKDALMDLAAFAISDVSRIETGTGINGHPNGLTEHTFVTREPFPEDYWER
jgi:hypothetical protein